MATQAGGNQGQDIMNIELTLIKNAGLQTEKRRGEIFTDDNSVSENVGKFLNLGKGWRNVGIEEGGGACKNKIEKCVLKRKVVEIMRG